MLNEKNRMPDETGRAEGEAVSVVIDGKLYSLTGDDPDYIREIAAYIDDQIRALRKTREFGRMSTEYRALMLWLRLADDCFRVKRDLKKMTEEREGQEAEIYTLKHQLVEKRLVEETAAKNSSEAEEKLKAAEEKLKAAEERIKELEAEIDELLAQ